MSTEERRRPYAAPANVIAVLQRCRTRNLPDVIDNDFLRLAGVSDLVFGRVREALRFLGMIGPDDRPTDTLKALSAAPDEQYRSILAGAVREAYREDFDRIDPAKDTQSQINDAFRPYQPRSQTARMVMMFLALAREAAIPVLDAPRQRQMKGSFKATVIAPRKRAVARQIATRDSAHGSDVAASPFVLSDEEIAQLTPEEFQSVWDALGLVARTRAMAKRRAQEPVTDTDGVGGDA